MRYIKSEKISPRKYLLTIEVSDNDLEMLEDIATTYEPFQKYQDNKEDLNIDLSSCHFTEKYQKWLLKSWRVFWKLWNKHDV